MYYSDKPISCSEDDSLKRIGFAKTLAQSLINLNSADTFTVGLFGKWGSGKTSLINLMLDQIEIYQKEKMERDKLIVVHFEPWNFSDTNQLLTQFFVRLSNDFKSKGDRNLEKIGAALETYSDAFDLTQAIPVVGSLVALFGKKGAATLGKKLKKGSDEKDISKQKESVVRLLTEQSKRILIVIDDIDRLSNEEICRVFQLITSVAKFPNTTYLLAFDKGIVVKALEKIQEGSGADYLEKIIQMPIQIPDIQTSALRSVLFNRLNKIMSEQKDVLFSDDHWQRLFEPCISPFIKNLRDISRLCNAVQFKLTAIASEVDFTDIVAISALEIYLPPVYDWVKVNKAVLTCGTDISIIYSRNKSQQEWLEYYRTQIINYENFEYCKDTNAEIAITFLSWLFPGFGQKVGKIYEVIDLNQFRRNNQIAHPDKFDRYFHLSIDEIGLKKADILNAVHVFDRETFESFLFKFERDGTCHEFLKEVKAMISAISLVRAKVIAEALFNASSQLDSVSQTNILSLSTSKYSEYIIIDLIDTMPSDERLNFISENIKNADYNSLQLFGGIINMLELGYGRLAANGAEHDYKKILTIEELLCLETVFLQQAKELLKSTSLFCFYNWGIVFYLLECFAPDYTKTYLDDAFKSDENVLRYLEHSISIWTGGSIEYEISDKYKKYLTRDCVLEAIQTQVHAGTLFSLPAKIQNLCGAFYLNSIGQISDDGHVTQSEVSSLLGVWQTNLQQ